MPNVPSGHPTSSPTTAAIVRQGIQYYVPNSTIQPAPLSPQILNYAWANIVIACCVLAHTFYLKRFKMGNSRTCIDICAIGTLLSGMVVLIAGYTPYSLASNAYLLDVAFNGIIACFVQSGDDLIFLLAFRMINKTAPRWLWALIWFYIIFVLYFTWLLQFTLFPLFMNTNSQHFNSRYIYPGLLLYTYGGVLYAFAFSAQFMYMLYRVNILRNIRVQKRAQLFAIKCSFHCVVSSIAILDLLFEGDQVIQCLLVYNIHVTVSLHAIFNFHIVEYLLQHYPAQKRLFVRFLQRYGILQNVYLKTDAPDLNESVQAARRRSSFVPSQRQYLERNSSNLRLPPPKTPMLVETNLAASDPDSPIGNISNFKSVKRIEIRKSDEDQ